jgi:hypothetical protein
LNFYKIEDFLKIQIEFLLLNSNKKMGLCTSKPPKYKEKNNPPQFLSALRDEARKEKEEKDEKSYQKFKEDIFKKINKEYIQKELKNNPEKDKLLVNDFIFITQKSWVGRLKKESPQYEFTLEDRNLYLILNDNLLI